MNTAVLRILTLIPTVVLVVDVTGQGQSQFQASPAGDQFLLNPAPPMFPFAPRSVNIGDGTTFNLSTLNVRGDQMPVVDAFAPAFLSTFRTDVGAQLNQSWSMVRGQFQIGRFYHTNPDNAFRIQAVQPNGTDPGILYLENSTLDGFMLRANGGQNPVNGYPLQLDGFASLGIRAMGTNGMPSRSRFQLVDNDAQAVVEPWRPTYRNGVLFTGNNDMAYIGAVYHDASNGTTPWTYTLDRSDLVISAGENDLTEALRQRISLRYTTTPNALATTGAASYNGLEFLQCWPETATQGYVGIGDFYAATVQNGGVQVNPTERLDMVNGRLRIRDLPNNSPLSNATKMMVVNSNGIVGWQSIGGAAFSCEWEVTSGAKKITTAYQGLGSNGTCPELDWRVGIGTNAPQAKLHTYVGPDDALDLALKAESNGLNTNGTLSSYAFGSESKASSAYEIVGAYGEGRMPVNTDGYLNTNSTVTGVSGFALIEGKTYQSFGGKFVSKLTNDANAQATEVFGAFCSGWSTQTAYPTKLYGMKGQVQRAAGATYPCYAVYGDAPANPIGGTLTSWAAWFQGDGFLSASMWNFSDSELKENVEPLQGSADLLTQVSPYSYNFNTAQNPHMGLAEGPQAGVLADELESVIPHLVRNVFKPAEFDSLGNEIAPAREFKAVNYIGLIPYLLGAVRELRQENVGMQQQLAACCAVNDDGSHMQQGTGIGYIDNTQRATEVTRQLSVHELLVAPNPFTENPTISYRLATSGRAQLRVSDTRSQQLGVLLDAGTEAGQHSMVWNTVGMAAGTYWLTLTVDGKRVTEQAVKVE